MTGVRVAFGKWGGGRHWEFDAVRLGDDHHGTWLGAPRDTVFTRPGGEFTSAWDQVVLVPQAGFLASFYEDVPAAPMHTYVDVTTSPRWAGPVLHTIDLDLDVVRDRDGRVFVDDDDEFAAHRVQLGYPAELVASALRTCAEVRDAVEGRRPPFDGPTADHWLAQLHR
ncbi:MAG: DUF402 domain-containing protein [Pseudonocardia sp.]